MAVAPCTRCGTFLCGACTEVMGEAAYCADCIAWLHKHGPVSRAVQALIVASILGILCLPLGVLLLFPFINLVVGVLGLWVPTRELRRIRRGEGPLRGIRQAQVARVLAAVNLVLALLGIAALLYVAVSVPS
ncbi:MAG: hypothetical protein ACJ8AT_11940 [Hyalangium sp.]|uniref:hypothetical protein n=1 Tax=Hyalangium sp. TaxID=2028555 RepID=UPI00389B01BA